MYRRPSRRLTRSETAILEDRFRVTDLDLTDEEIGFLEAKARQKILKRFRTFPPTIRKRSTGPRLHAPATMRYFIRANGMRNGDLAKVIHLVDDRFIEWKTIKSGQLQTLDWLLEIAERPAITIMLLIELRFIHWVIDDMVHSEDIWSDPSLFWGIKPELLVRVSS